MKTFNIKLLFAFFAATFLLAGCKKSDNELSRPTYLPDIAIKGDFDYVVTLGEEYEEPGAIATVNGEPIEYTIKGSVDPNQPGVYILTYTASNTDGFSATATRNVYVAEEFIPESASLEGNYKRGTRVTKVTTIADGIYAMSDGWGTATSGGQPLPIPCYLFCPDGENILMPTYPTIFGAMEGEGTYDGAQMEIVTTLVDQGPLTVTRIWIKQ